ncbi:MAG: hypothetical protein WCE68_09360 [Anaerolineales bacterium]
MPHKWGAVLLLCLFLAACAAKAPAATPPVPTAIPTLTLPQPSTAPTATPTIVSMPTATGTDTPTPTNTPVFDPRHIQTATLAPPAMCPILDANVKPPSLNIDWALDDSPLFRIIILDYLNNYGLTAFMQQEALTRRFVFADLINDGLNEIIYQSTAFLMVFGCWQNKFQVLLLYPFMGSAPGGITLIKDVNHDGIPELVFNTGYAIDGIHSYMIYEWDGSQLKSRITNTSFENVSDSVIVNATGYISFDDANRDGLPEFIAHSGVEDMMSYLPVGPWRNVNSIYQWNGNQYIFTREEWAPPEYRFQAVQDADRLFKDGEYERALALYQYAITSDRLKWWSPELQFFYQQKSGYERGWVQALEVPPPPAEDRNEYIALSAYSYFRIMLIHLIQGQVAAARSDYELTQTRFLDNPYGKAFAEIAATFWDEYTATQNLVSACQKASAYAELHQDVLLPYLGNLTDVSNPNYIEHGDQSLDYEPESICPLQ